MKSLCIQKCYYPLAARLNFTGEGYTFYVHDNPFIHAIDEKLQAAKTSSTKLLFDYLKTEEYKEWVHYYTSIQYTLCTNQLHCSPGTLCSVLQCSALICKLSLVCLFSVCTAYNYVVCMYMSEHVHACVSEVWINTIVISHACTCQGV